MNKGWIIFTTVVNFDEFYCKCIKFKLMLKFNKY